MTSKEDSGEWLERLKALYSAKYGKPIKIELGNYIKCLNPEHEHTNRENKSMIVNADKAFCFGCGYTISKNKKIKPFKEDLPNLILSEFISKCAEHKSKDFLETRKYSPDILKELRIGYSDIDVYQELQEKYGLQNLKSAKLANANGYLFTSHTIIPHDEYYFSVKPSDISLSGKKKQAYTIKGSSDLVILCEGQTDAIALHHIYPEHTVIALLGVTSQKPLQSIYQQTVWICFDNDAAGKDGIEKARANLKDKDIFLVKFPGKYKDIDEVYRDLTKDSTKVISISKLGTNQLINPEYEKITKSEYQEVINSNFPGLWPTVDLCISVIAINKLEKWTDPVNVNLLGPPSSEKTTALSLFYDAEGIVIKSDTFTPKSFVTHSVTVPDDKLEEVDMLPKIQHKTLITPELGSIFSKRKEDLTEVIGILTRVFDGEGLETDSGARGHRGYKGDYTFTMLGATTPLPKSTWNIMSKMGSRMFFYSVPDFNSDDDTLLKIYNSNQTYGEHLRLCREASVNMIYSIFDGFRRDIPWDDSNDDIDAGRVLANCAQLISVFRSALQAWDDEFSEDKVQHEVPLTEKPFRALNILKNIAKGHAITEGRKNITLDDVYLMPVIVSSTMPEDRAACWRSMLPLYKDIFSRADIERNMNITEKVARRVESVFVALGIWEKVNDTLAEKGQGQEPSNKIHYRFTSQITTRIDNILAAFPHAKNVTEVFLSPCPKNASIGTSPCNSQIYHQNKKNHNNKDIHTNSAPILAKKGQGDLQLKNLRNFVIKYDSGEGASTQTIIDCGFAESFISKALSDGVLFEPRPGRLKVLE